MRLLLVDSDADCREALERACRDAGDEISCAESLAHAKQILRRGDVDLAFVASAALAGRSGTTAELWGDDPPGIFLLLDDPTQVETVTRCPNVEGFAAKPLEPALLRAHLEIARRRRGERARGEAILAALPDLMFRQTRDGVYVDYHAPSPEKLVATPEEFLGKSCLDVLPGDLGPRILRLIEATIDTGEPQTIEYAVDIPGFEEPQHFEARLVVCDGTQVLSIVRDITELKRANLELVRSQETTRAILDGIPDTLFRLSRHGIFLDFFPKHEFPIAIGSHLIGKNGPEIVAAVPGMPRDLVDETLAAARQALAGQGVQTISRTLGEGDRARHYETRIVACGEDEAIGIVRDITDIKNAEEQLRAAAEVKQALASRVLKAQERERDNVARELHDAIGQMLLVHKLDAEWIRAQAKDHDIETAADALARSLDETLHMVRKLAQGLRPPALDALGIGPALESLLTDLGARRGIGWSCSIAPGLPETDEERGIALYRIAQEALVNAIKHSSCRNLSLSLRAGDRDTLELTIEDDGVGIDLTRVDGRDSIGILGMRERAELVGGLVDIRSKPDGGTVVTASIPRSCSQGK